MGLSPASSSGGGVSSFAKQGSTALTGAVTISEGAGVTLTEAGQNIAIAAAGGSFVPIADPVGVTVDTTTYDNPVTGIGKITTLVFPSTTVAWATAVAGDAFPRVLLCGAEGIFIGDGTYDAYNEPTGLVSSADGFGKAMKVAGFVLEGGFARSQTQVAGLQQVTSAALGAGDTTATTALVSGTGSQISTAGDRETVTPVTFNPGAATTATCLVQISPDDVAYVTLGTETVTPGTTLDGTIRLVKVRVPQRWYLKLTVTNATLGTTTFY